MLRKLWRMGSLKSICEDHNREDAVVCGVEPRAVHTRFMELVCGRGGFVYVRPPADTHGSQHVADTGAGKRCGFGPVADAARCGFVWLQRGYRHRCCGGAGVRSVVVWLGLACGRDAIADDGTRWPDAAGADVTADRSGVCDNSGSIVVAPAPARRERNCTARVQDVGVVVVVIQRGSGLKLHHRESVVLRRLHYPNGALDGGMPALAWCGIARRATRL